MAMIAGVELWQTFRKGQMEEAKTSQNTLVIEDMPVWEQFYSLAA